MDFNQFNNILYGGSWQEGTSQTLYQVTNPYNREVLTEIRLNSVQDIDQAYQTALKAQRAGRKRRPPAKRKSWSGLLNCFRKSGRNWSVF